jgi:hypothetical protein
VGEHGCPTGNLIPNCNFDTFYGSPPRQIPTDWVPFVLSGSLDFRQHTDTVWGAPSLRMWSNGDTFVAGIYTQVGGLTPGVAYKASIGWGAPNAPDAFGRRLGIDPTGGTDPNAATVVWGPMHRGPGRILNYAPPDVNVDVSAVARSATVTVFVYVDHNYSTGDNFIFIDAVSLIVDPAQPTATPIPPTAEPVHVQTAPSPEPSAHARADRDCYGFAFANADPDADVIADRYRNTDAAPDVHADALTRFDPAPAANGYARNRQREHTSRRYAHEWRRALGAALGRRRRAGGSGCARGDSCDVAS